MKIAISSSGTSLDSELDPRFGRAHYILIVDDLSMNFEIIDNMKNKNGFKGAGINAATSIKEKGADLLMTGYCGPNAFKVLSSCGIRIVNDVKGSVRDAVELFKSGNCEFADSANADAHWG